MPAHHPELQNELNEAQSSVESPSNGSSNGTAEDPACPETSRGERTRTVADPERTRRNQTTTDQPAPVAAGGACKREQAI